MSGPLPSADVCRRTPNTEELVAGTTLHRFYTAAYDPIFFDRSGQGRFNAPDNSYGVLYAARTLAGAFAETFLREPGRTLIDLTFVGRKASVQIEVVETLKLIRFVGPGLAKLGATAEVPHSGLPYDVPQIWSKALHDHPVMADGITYHARHDDTEICYALFDRARAKLVERSRSENLDQDWFWECADRYGIGLVP